MKNDFDTANLTVEEYLLLEEDSLERHEYLRGARREVSGSTINHSLLVGTTLSLIHQFLRESNFQLYHLQIKVCVEKENFFAYPDLMIVAGKPQMWNGRDDTIVNPEVIIEIFTESRDSFDWGEKFSLYRSLPSLKEFILISSNSIYTESYLKKGEGLWNFFETEHPEDFFQIDTIGFCCPVKELYYRVTFE